MRANAAINRNIAIYDRFVINTTGELAWETPIFDYTEISALHSSGPIIADSKAISGRSCGRLEACVIVAHEARTARTVASQDHSAPRGEPGTWHGSNDWEVGVSLTLGERQSAHLPCPCGP